MNLSVYGKFAVKTALKAGDILIRNYGKIQALEWKLKTAITVHGISPSRLMIWNSTKRSK